MKEIKAWRKATEDLTKAFVKKYFPEFIYCDDFDSYWIGDEIGSVFYICDMLLDINRMIEALELEATFEQISDYADLELEYALKEPEKPTPINFKNYVKYGFVNKSGE